MKKMLFAVGAALAMQASGAGAQGQAQVDASKIGIVLKTQRTDTARISKDQSFRSGDVELKYDMYTPKTGTGKRAAIVFVSGTSETRHWLWFQDYGQIATAMGFVGFVPDKRLPYTFAGTETGTADTIAFIEHLRANSDKLGIDPERICIWTFSGAGRVTALPYRPEGAGIACHVAYYGVMTVRDQVSPETPNRDAILTRYSADAAVAAADARKVPTLVVRAGKDTPPLNGTIDRFVAAAVAADLPLTFVNYPDGRHGFDGLDDTDRSRQIVRQSFEFVREATEPHDPNAARPVQPQAR